MKQIAHPKPARRFGYPKCWLAALVFLLLVPPAAAGGKAPEKQVIPPGQGFAVPGGLCPLSVLTFDRDGDGEPDRVIVELDLTCTARAQRALKEIKSAAEDAMQRLAPAEPESGLEGFEKGLKRKKGDTP